MKRTAKLGLPGRYNDVDRRWSAVTYDDAAGIDRDIDELLTSMQAKQGVSRKLASMELIDKLSLGVGRRRSQEAAST